MAGLSSPGIGSGLDINGLIAKLMSVEQQPLVTLAKREAALQGRLSAIGTVKGAIASLQGAAASLSDAGKFQVQKTTVADSSVLTATAGASAAAGSYKISVTTLAQAQTLHSSGHAATTTAIGSAGDTLTFQFGTYGEGSPAADFTLNPDKAALTVTLAEGQNTLSGIRDAINAANGAVTASIVNDGSGDAPYRLVVMSKDTGTAHAMKITASAGLADFAYDATQAINPMTEPAGGEARDAALTINGIAIASASNTLVDAIEGVTLNLLDDGGATTTLTVARDTGAIQGAVQSFVSAYNGAVKAIKDVSSYDSETKKAGMLLGDATILALENQLRAVLNAPVEHAAGGLTTLSQIGVSVGKDGTLALDSATLQEVMSDAGKDISTLFAAVGKTTDSLIDFSASGSDTQPGSYAINISTLATQGSALGSMALAGSTVIVADDNDSLDVVVDGLEATITLGAGSYTPAQLAAEIQSKINGASAIVAAESSVAVSVSAGKLLLTSDRYGSASNVSIVSGSATAVTGSATGTDGEDVAGTIGGVSASGSGQSLTGSGDADGLEIVVKGGATGSRGSITFSQGYAYQLNELISQMLADDGLFDGKSDSINDSISDIGKQREAMNARLAAVEARYRSQFNALDALVARMQSTQSYLTQQLDQLSALNKEINS